MDDQDLFDIVFPSVATNTNQLDKHLFASEYHQNEENQSKTTDQKLLENISIIEQTSYNPSFREIPRFRKPFGGIARFIKRIIRKLTKFYIEPYSEQQNQFNKAVDNSIKGLFERSEEEHNSSIATKEELSKLQQEFHQAFQKVSEMEDAACQIKLISLQANNQAILSYAQSGEDSIIQYILKYLGIQINKIRYLDLGANHAKEISNTYSLYAQGARGVLLEANPNLIPELSLFRGEDVIIPKCLVAEHEEKTIPFYILNGDGLSSFDKEAIDEAIIQNSSLKIESVEQVQTISMNEIIERYFPIAPDLLNIDIEGSEEQILESVDFEKWRPFIIILETIPYHPYLVFDEKRQELVKFLQDREYTEYAFTGINSIMLDKRQLYARIKK